MSRYLRGDKSLQLLHVLVVFMLLVLLMSIQRITSLSCLYFPQAHLVAAFEQSLGNMTIRLKSLTLTAEQKVKTAPRVVKHTVGHKSWHTMKTSAAGWPGLTICHVFCTGLGAEWTEEDHRAAEEAECRRSSCHQRRHQHSWTCTQRRPDRYEQAPLTNVFVLEGLSVCWKLNVLL